MPLNQVDISLIQDIPAPGVAGKVLSSDGTNWVNADGASLPATGADGNVLTSDGTNWASETPAVDLSALKADILKLALHQAIDGNRVAYNLEDSFVDGFEDDSGITTETTVDRNSSGEYVSSSQAATIASTTKLLIDSNTTEGSTTFTDLSSVGRTITANSTISHTTAQKKFGLSSLNYNGGTSWLYTDDAADLRFGTSIHTIEFWFKQNLSENGHFVNKWIAGSYDSFYIHVTGSVLSVKANSSGSSWDINVNGSTNVADNAWHHCACTLNGTALTLWLDGASELTGTVGNSGQIFDGTGKWTLGGKQQDGNGPYTGYMEDIHFSTDVKYTGSFTPAQSHGSVVAATGTLISDPQTASTSRTSASGVIIYEDADGTNTLGTDLKIYFTANNGTNWTEAASYGTATTYSGTKKLVKLGATTVTAGTSVAMKAEWANQAVTGAGSYVTGNRAATITVTSDLSISGGAITTLVDGTISTGGGFYPTSAGFNPAGKYIQFQFSTAQTITAVKFHTSNSHEDLGVWKWQGSNDASSWTDVSGNVTLGDAVTDIMPLTNSTAYVYYRALGVSGSGDATWVYEMEFEHGGAIGKEARLHGWAVNY